mmetsp:Transcript_8485/g.25685  ORF Transcript_8485/g.25685 Transcript_8485/m.25685 type:complete len:238 (-) Transcript_8485:877-1590(-)
MARQAGQHLPQSGCHTTEHQFLANVFAGHMRFLAGDVVTCKLDTSGRTHRASLMPAVGAHKLGSVLQRQELPNWQCQGTKLPRQHSSQLAHAEVPNDLAVVVHHSKAGDILVLHQAHRHNCTGFWRARVYFCLHQVELRHRALHQGAQLREPAGQEPHYVHLADDSSNALILVVYCHAVDCLAMSCLGLLGGRAARAAIIAKHCQTTAACVCLHLLPVLWNEFEKKLMQVCVRTVGQ